MPQGAHAHTKLVKNGQVLVRTNGAHWDESSHTAVVELKASDVVSVQSDELQGTDFFGYAYSSFSGFLLYDYSDVISVPVVGK